MCVDRILDTTLVSKYRLLCISSGVHRYSSSALYTVHLTVQVYRCGVPHHESQVRWLTTIPTILASSANFPNKSAGEERGVILS